jgi:hypothetical protein
MSCLSYESCNRAIGKDQEKHTAVQCAKEKPHLSCLFDGQMAPLVLKENFEPKGSNFEM